MTDTEVRAAVENKLKSDNYEQWVCDMEATLKTAKVWWIVTGEEVAPDAKATAETRLHYLNCVDSACGLILKSIDHSQRVHISDCRSDPKKMWEALRDAHNKQMPVTRFNAYDTLFNVRLAENESFTELIARVERAAVAAKGLRPQVFTLEDLDDELKSMALIRSLPMPDYLNFVSTLTSLPSFKFAEVKEKFILYENMNKPRATELPIAANAANTPAKPSSNRPYCAWCNSSKFNHRTEECKFMKAARTKDIENRKAANQNKRANNIEEVAEFASTASAFLSNGSDLPSVELGTVGCNIIIPIFPLFFHIFLTSFEADFIALQLYSF
jgi:hypothetical protein